MEPLHINTPLLESFSLSQRLGKDVRMKMDALQPPGSFKIRGIGHLCQQLHKRGAQEFVSSSGGNAGLATAYAAYKLKVPCTVFVPETTKSHIIKKIDELGAQAQVFGKVWDEAHEKALELVAQREGAQYIHPFDHPLIWEGHKSIINEVVETGFVPDAIAVAVGGGGLFLGIMHALEALGLENTRVFACETEGAASFAACKREGLWVSIDKVTSIATSLGAKQIAESAFPYSHHKNVQSFTCSDEEALSACKAFSQDHRVLVEPACGAALAALYERPEILSDAQKVLGVVCGGVGI